MVSLILKTHRLSIRTSTRICCIVRYRLLFPKSVSKAGHTKAIKRLKKNKVKIADYFLLQKLDLTYRNEDGNNVLMAVITSFLPEQWKEKAVSVLLDKGVDLKEKNLNGDTALDIAKFKGNESIVKLVTF